MRRGRLRNLQDCCYHLTPRCQDGGFLLRFKRDRRNYLARLRESIERTPVDVLDHVHTSNHVHLLLWATDGADVSAAMQYLQGTAARDYNRRKKRRGAYWADRFHPTLVQTGPHLSRCLFYMALNMVRARAVSHPSEWETSGYRELTGDAGDAADGSGIIRLERLLWCLGMPGEEAHFRSWYRRTVDELSRTYLAREPWWSEAAAVGGRDWIENLAGSIVVGRRRIEPVPAAPAPVLREDDATYALHTGRRASDALIAAL